MRTGRASLIAVTACLLFAKAAFAEVSIETAVSRSQLSVGEQLTLDIIISNADGRIEQPSIRSIDGFMSYSQGHSQELSIINGQSSSRSIYTYVLIANSTGEKMIGPFAIVIGGKEYKIAPVKVEVTNIGISAPSSQAGPYNWTQQPSGPVLAPPPRAMAGVSVGDQEIFVKAWLDKDEVYVNEPVVLTYTLFYSVSATIKGFDKDPVTTGFWVEDFPPDRASRHRTEQYLNGQRYIVEDVRKIALFPTQAGVFTIDPGTISAAVQPKTDTFNYGSPWGTTFPSIVTVQAVPKELAPDSVRVVVKTLPEVGKPKDFTGAVGRYEIESSTDKDHAEVGDPVTLRVRITGKGNINTIEPPGLPRMDDFKVYPSSSSANISKKRQVVEGEKITETVIVPRKPGKYEIPAIPFTYFDPETATYITVKSDKRLLEVTGTAQTESTASSSAGTTASETIFGPEEKEDVDVAKDIRFIKTLDPGQFVPEKEIYRQPFYWVLNFLLIVLGVGSGYISMRRASGLPDVKGSRLRRSHSVARAKLRAASQLMKEEKSEAFYGELSRAVTGYFADKFNVSAQGLTVPRIEEMAHEHVSAEQMNKIRRLFDEMSMGRFSRVQKSRDDMKELYEMADEVITSFEKVKLK